MTEEDIRALVKQATLTDDGVPFAGVLSGRAVVTGTRAAPLIDFGATITGARVGEVKATQFPFSANPRARILGEPEGMVRLVCEASTGRVLGVHILGPRATDLIAEGALAVQVGATADDLAWATHGHPTLPEAVLEAALGFSDATVHVHSR